MASKVKTGLAVASGSNPVLHTATFDNVTVNAGIVARDGVFSLADDFTQIRVFPNPVKNNNLTIQLKASSMEQLTYVLVILQEGLFL